MKQFLMIAMAAVMLTVGASTGYSQQTPKSVIHVVTVKWKAGTTPAQIKAALDGVHALQDKYPGIINVWTRSIKVQGGKSHAFVMEFKDEKALAAYADSDAQKAWYKLYLPIREESTTFDITN